MKEALSRLLVDSIKNLVIIGEVKKKELLTFEEC
jgi:hypothetical protein